MRSNQFLSNSLSFVFTSLVWMPLVFAKPTVAVRCELAVVSPNYSEVSGEISHQDLLLTRVPRRDRRLLTVPKLAEVKNMSLPRGELESLVHQLPQSDRALIFFNLLDHPDMIFGRLGEVVMNLLGSSTLPLSLRKFGAVRKNERYLLDSLKKSPWVPQFGTHWQTPLAEHFLQIIMAAAHAPVDATKFKASLTNYEKEKYFNLEKYTRDSETATEVTFAIEPGDIRQLSKLDYDNEIGPDATAALKALKKFAPFFDWLAEKPERLQYARLMLSVAVEPLYLNFYLQPADKLKKNLEALEKGRDAAVVQNRLSGVSSGSSRDANYLASAVLNTKIDIGQMMRSFPEAKPTDGILRAQYVSVMRPTIHEVKALQNTDLRVLNDDEYTDSLPELSRLALAIINGANHTNMQTEKFKSDVGDELNRLVSDSIRHDPDLAAVALDHLASIETQILRVKEDFQILQSKLNLVDERLTNFRQGIAKLPSSAAGRADTLLKLDTFEQHFIEIKNQQLTRMSASVEELSKIQETASLEMIKSFRNP